MPADEPPRGRKRPDQRGGQPGQPGRDSPFRAVRQAGFARHSLLPGRPLTGGQPRWA